jgi:putative PIN family toxin of toxin-antitoxin system
VRLVLDTDVVVAAMRSPTGASAELLRRIDHGAATLLLSAPLVLEYEAICHLADHRLASGLDADEVAIFLDALMDMAEPVTTWFRWRPQLRDPCDEMVLEAAVNGQAATIVTFNLRDFGSAPGRFGIAVMRPADALRGLVA